MKKAPIAFFAFKRPDHTRRALESLAQNEGADKSELFIFCDGARRADEQISVEQVREVVRSKQWCGKVHVIEQKENMGLARATISGITEICNQHDRVIVLEDDSFLCPHFLNYMNDALEKYQAEPRVMHISGYMWPLQSELPETFFLRLSATWGWATWQRAWQHFDPNEEALLARIQLNKFGQEFSLNGAKPYLELLEKQARGEIDSWSIRWYASIFLNKGLSLYPKQSLVKNIGHDGTGTHCGITSVFDTSLYQDKILFFEDTIEENPKVINDLAEYFESLKPRRGSLLERGTHRLNKILRTASHSLRKI